MPMLASLSSLCCRLFATAELLLLLKQWLWVKPLFAPVLRGKSSFWKRELQGFLFLLAMYKHCERLSSISWIIQMWQQKWEERDADGLKRSSNLRNLWAMFDRL